MPGIRLDPVLICPICNGPCFVDGDMREDGTTTCPHGHFSETHAYGTHELSLSDGHEHTVFRTGWSYNQPSEQAIVREKMVQAAIAYIKFIGFRRYTP